jgi:methylenetetrahydrofolate dehydrogenase (NADP+)/methenyltetrahydrofolate cyclohydrolase
MLHMPMPAHVDVARVQYAIDVVKDVEGVNPANIGYVLYKHVVLAPCTAMAAVELIKHTRLPLDGAEAVVVGASHIVGKPIAMLLTEQLATVTTLPHRHAGPGLPHPPGRHPRGGRGQGWADRAGPRQRRGVRDRRRHQPRRRRRRGVQDRRRRAADRDEKAAFLSPVPGGVGPMTVRCC